MPVETKLAAALEAVRRGFAVFPIIENGKSPAIENWQNLATTDESQIRKWWSTRDYNIGTPTEGRLVFDIDPRKGGMDSFQALQLQHEFPKTLRTITASGGAHVVYAREEHTSVRNSAGELGPGLDIRADGGLIVLPGSTIGENTYKWGNDRAPAIATQDLVSLCKARKPKTAAAGKRLVEEDDAALELAWQWLTNHAPHATLGGLKDAAYRVACQMYDFGLSEASCRQYLREWGNSHCNPRLEDDTVESTARHALQYRGNAVGSKHPDAPGFEPVTIAERAVEAAVLATRDAQKGLYYLSFKDAAARALTHSAEPLVTGLIDCETMSVIYGESNSGKSFTEMDKDFRIAIGEPVAGRAVKQGAVVWVAAEGGSGVYKRLAALKAHYKRDEAPFYIIPCPVDLRRADADVKPLIALIKQIESETGQKVVKVTIDTLSRVMAGGDENSPVDMGQLVHHFDAIRYVTKAHVAIIHHTGKDKAKGARGHSLLRAATDTEIEVDSKTITVTKQRDLEGDIKMYFGLVVVRIGVDGRGHEVTSCYVEMGSKDSLKFDVPATKAEADLMRAIETALLTADGPEFGWEFVVDNCPKTRLLKSDKTSDKKRGASTVREHLSALSEKGYLKELFPNQYVAGCRSLSEVSET